MRVFLSYSADQRPLAESINHLLLSDGHDVFFDRDDLPPGETYADRIRRALERCHVFVFLLSPESVSPGSYALSELAILQDMQRRRAPTVLPVLAVPGLQDRIPPYLRPLTLFEPRGDPAAEIAARIEYLDQRRRKRLLRAAALVGVLVLAVLGLTTTQARNWFARAPAATAATTPAAERAPTLLGQPGNGEWLLYFQMPDYSAREIFYRFENEPEFKSIGLERTINMQTGRPQARLYITVPGLKEDRTLYLKFVDSAGKERGPYRVAFDLKAQSVAAAKQVLDISPQWLHFRHWPTDSDIVVYFTNLLVHKNALTGIHYSFDDESLGRTVRFTVDTARAGMPLMNDADELYVAVPKGTKFLAVQVRFIDGSQTAVRQFPVVVN
jgi:hypothetical protein